MIDVAEVYVWLAEPVSELRRADRSNDGLLRRAPRDCYASNRVSSADRVWTERKAKKITKLEKV